MTAWASVAHNPSRSQYAAYRRVMDGTETEPGLDMTPETVRVLPLWKYESLKEQIDALGARARKLGMTGDQVPGVFEVSRWGMEVWSLDYKSGDYWFPALLRYRADARPAMPETGEGEVRFPMIDGRPGDRSRLCRDAFPRDLDLVHVAFTLQGINPRLQGWSLAAVLEPLAVYNDAGEEVTETQVRTVPGQSVPEDRYNAQTDPALCDHCGKRRRRSATFVLVHEDGAYKQIGRQCVRDFLGHTDPERIWQMMSSLWDLIGESSSEEADPDGESFGRGRRVPTPLQFVAAAVVSIRVNGWVSKAAGESGVRESTSSNVRGILRDWDRLRPQVPAWQPEAKDWDKARAALEWGRSLKGGEFETKLCQAARAVEAGDNVAGLLAYLPAAYDKARGEDVSNRTKGGDSTLQGAVGERLERELTVRTAKAYDSVYGVSTLVLLRDAEGNEYKWWASGADMLDCIGLTGRVRGTVKDHETERGNVTLLTRVQLVKGARWEEK